MDFGGGRCRGGALGATSGRVMPILRITAHGRKQVETDRRGAVLMSLKSLSLSTTLYRPCAALQLT